MTSDPTPIFEHYRGSYGSELLVAAVAHFGLFAHLAERPLSTPELREKLALAERPFLVLTTALRAMQLLGVTSDGEWNLTPLAREHLTPGSPFYVGDYVGLSAESPGVLEMTARLRTNRPQGADAPDQGAAFIFKAGEESAMEQAASARHFTLALAGRARNVAPVLAQRLPLPGVRRLLDLGGGTGIYSLALLQQNPTLRAVVFDRPEVLKVAAEFAAEAGLTDRVDLVAGDMFRDPWPTDCQAVLLSNILHDWDVPDCQRLLARCAAALPGGGRVCIHDVFLNDALDGPLPLALYSAALFCFTEGRAYSQGEYAAWLRAAGFAPSSAVPTLIHCGVLTGVKG